MHFSQRVGHEVPGVEVWPCFRNCGQFGQSPPQIVVKRIRAYGNAQNPVQQFDRTKHVKKISKTMSRDNGSAIITVVACAAVVQRGGRGES